MAKTYVTNTKYEIVSNFSVEGVVDKHDVIGAIFGQSEGLLGEDMDLRELQKNGKIGRIEIELKSKDGKSTGTVHVPSSMDMAETCTLAATIESVDKVGPCDSQFTTDKILDKRATKRQDIVNRAQSLLQKMVTEEIPDSGEITGEVRDKVKIGTLTSWGASSLAAGPDVTTDDNLIVVEGRADVLTLLKNNIRNSISMNGANVPAELSKLLEHKVVTVFIDGDRGGELNLRKLMAIGKVDFVARAPTGKEVEELQRKEIIAALKHTLPVTEFLSKRKLSHIPVKKDTEFSTPRGRPTRRTSTINSRSPRKPYTPKPYARKPLSEQTGTFGIGKPKPIVSVEDKAMFQTDITELNGTLNARLFDKNKKLIKEVPVRQVLKEVEATNGIETIAMDGIVTERLSKLSEKRGVKKIAGIREGNIKERPKNLQIISFFA